MREPITPDAAWFRDHWGHISPRGICPECGEPAMHDDYWIIEGGEPAFPGSSFVYVRLGSGETYRRNPNSPECPLMEKTRRYLDSQG